MPCRSLVGVTVLVLLLAFATALAHRGATGIIKQRMDAMMSLGGAMKALTAMMSGKQPYDAERVKAYAGTIAGHGGESLTSLFPEGSLKHPSRANPAIWTDWGRFSALAQELAVYAGALASAASNQRASIAVSGGKGPGTRRRDTRPEDLATVAPNTVFMLLRRTCSNCHRTYRTKK